MKPKVTLFLFVVLLSSIFALSCVPVEKQCAVDADCAAASCCHATEAVNKAYQPDCQGQFCTLECKPGTLDCSQAKIACVSRRCTVVPVEE